MNKSNAFSIRCSLVLGVISGALTLFPTAQAQSLYYNTAPAAPVTWFGNSWSTSSSGPYTSPWTDGNTAIFNFSTGQTVQVLGSNVQLTGLTSLGSTVSLTGTSTGPRKSITFANGSQISSPSTSNIIEFANNLDIVGDFTLTSGQITFGAAGTAMSYVGTATVNSGARIQFNNAISASSANFVVNGSLRTGGGTRSLGGITVNSGGTFDMGAGGTDATNATIKSLAGAVGGVVTVRTGVGVAVHQFTIDQATNTTFSGTLQGTNANGQRRLKLTKTNTGTLTLDGGLVNLQEGTTVSGGTLLINGGGTRTFDNLSSANAITVASGGAFGGSSNLTISGGENVVVQDGGALIAGAGLATTGTTGFTFESGGSLDLSQVSNASDWLFFDLGSTSDQIVVSGGTLALGSGLLEFDDFSFTTLSGFGAGTYTLFAAEAHSGSLGSLLSGAIGDDYTGTLSLNGSDVVLEVSAVPEPQAAIMVPAGFMITFGLLRRRRFTDRS